MRSSPGTRRGLLRARALTALLTALAAGGASVATAASPLAIPILPGESWIAFTRNAIFLIRPDGSDEHMILPQFADPNNGDEWLHGAYDPEWSADGTRIVFPNGTLAGWPIWVANADGSDARELIACGTGCQFLDAPAWSPDGRSVAYVRFNGEWPPSTTTFGSRVEILDLDTGTTRTVLESMAPDFFEGPRWSPDGRSLVLTAFGNDNGEIGYTGTAIAVADISGPGLATAEEITPRDMWAAYPDWRPTGDRLVFSTYDVWMSTDHTAPSNLYTSRVDGSDLQQLTTFGKDDVRASQPTWTPDGTQVIFAYIRRPLDARIAFIDPDGTDLRVMEGPWATHPRLRPIP